MATYKIIASENRIVALQNSIVAITNEYDGVVC